MHFDEVYHARTATEFLQSWRYGDDHDIYEWTHPHLAKYAMAGGIVLWGEDDVSATSELGVPVRAVAHEPRREDVVTEARAGERAHVATGDGDPDLRPADARRGRSDAGAARCGARLRHRRVAARHRLRRWAGRRRRPRRRSASRTASRPRSRPSSPPSTTRSSTCSRPTTGPSSSPPRRTRCPPSIPGRTPSSARSRSRASPTWPTAARARRRRHARASRTPRRPPRSSPSSSTARPPTTRRCSPSRGPDGTVILGSPGDEDDARSRARSTTGAWPASRSTTGRASPSRPRRGHLHRPAGAASLDDRHRRRRARPRRSSASTTRGCT